MLNELIANGETKMDAVIDSTKKAYAGIRTGRANPALLDRISVEYYGTMTPLNQLANISIPDPRMILIQPYDKTTVKAIDKAIQASDLGLMPNNDGNVLRLAIPPLTEERRKQLVKVVRKEAEERKVAVRNIRRELNDDIKKSQKSGAVPEDEARRALDEVQELTDSYVTEIDRLTDNKEKEIMEI